MDNPDKRYVRKVIPDAAQQLQPYEQQELYDAVNSLLADIGITVHNKAEMDAFLKQHGVDSVQELL